MRIALSIGAAFLIMNLATFVTYGSLAVIMGLEPPADGSPGQFFVSVLVVKLGLAGGFVAFYHIARSSPELCVKAFEQAPRHVHHTA